MEEIAAVKAVLRSILMSDSSNDGLSIDKVCRDFRTIEGSPLPFRKLGYMSAYHLLKSLPDVAYFLDEFRVKAVASDKNQHIAQMISAQKKPKRQAKVNIYRNSFRTSWRAPQQTYRNNSYGYQQQNFNSYSYGGRTHNQQSYNSPQIGQTTNFYQQYISLQPTPQPVHNYAAYQSNYQQNYVPQPRLPAPIPYQVPFQVKQEEVKSKAIPILEPHKKTPEMKVVNDLIDLSTPEPVVQKPPRKLDCTQSYVSLLEMELSEIESTKIPEPLFEGDEMKQLKDDFDNISIIGKHDDLHSISDAKSFHEQQQQEKARATNPFLADDNLSDISDAFEHIEDEEIFMKVEVPPYWDQPYRIPDNEERLDKDEIFRLYVSHVHSPSRFWFQNAETTDSFEQLIEDMTGFYKTLGPTNMKVPEKKMQLGLPCCVYLYDQWNRGEIIGEPADDQVRIYFVDYGTNASVETAKVKYLLRVFAKLPRQAYRGCLDGVQPVKYSMNFEMSTVTEFHNLVSSKTLWAKIVAFRENEAVHLLSLVDKTSNDEKSINKLMLVSQHTKRVHMKTMLGGKVIEGEGPLCYDYPLFKTLETTDYPGYYDRKVYLSNFCDFNVLEATNFLTLTQQEIVQKPEVIEMLKLCKHPLVIKIKKFITNMGMLDPKKQSAH